MKKRSALFLLAFFFLSTFTVFTASSEELVDTEKKKIEKKKDDIDLNSLLSALGGVGGATAFIGFFLKRLVSNYDEKLANFEKVTEKLAARDEQLAEKIDERLARFEKMLEKHSDKNDDSTESFEEKLTDLMKAMQSLELELAGQRAQIEIQKKLKKAANAVEYGQVLKEIFAINNKVIAIQDDLEIHKGYIRDLSSKRKGP